MFGILNVVRGNENAELEYVTYLASMIVFDLGNCLVEVLHSIKTNALLKSAKSQKLLHKAKDV